MVQVISEPVRQVRRFDKARLTHHQGALSGLLIAVLFVGSIDIALRAYSAIGTKPQTEKVVSVKIQDRLAAVMEDSQKALQTSTSPGALKPLQTPDPSACNHESDVTGAFNVSNIHPTDGFDTAPATRRGASTHPNLAVSSTVVLQSQTAEEFQLPPVPTRKPKNPKTKEPLSSTAQLKAKGGGHEEGGPRALAFGSIGYNYNPQP